MGFQKGKNIVSFKELRTKKRQRRLESSFYYFAGELPLVLCLDAIDHV